MEPMVVNETNADLAIENDLIEWLGKILIFEDNIFTGLHNSGNPVQDAG